MNSNDDRLGAGSSNFEEWKNRAQKAHKLVADVDFEKIAQHDPAAVSQLEEKQLQLNSLADDSSLLNPIERLPGIDNDSMRVAIHLERLDAAGFGHRLGRVLVVREGKAAMRPLEIVPHREGLPSFDLCLAAEQGENSGAHAIFITDTEIIEAFAKEPLVQNPWQLLNQHTYADSSELIELLSTNTR